MWAQACELMDEAERLHRQFFRPAAVQQAQVVWEPPVDLFENEREIVLVVAMPGVSAERIQVVASPAPSSCAERARCRWCPACRYGGWRSRTASSSGASSCRRAAWSSSRRSGAGLPDPAAAQGGGT
jgi:hypothetical protein